MLDAGINARTAVSLPLMAQKSRRYQSMSASLIGRLGSSTFRLSTAAVSMSLTGSCFFVVEAFVRRIKRAENKYRATILAAPPVVSLVHLRFGI